MSANDNSNSNDNGNGEGLWPEAGPDLDASIALVHLDNAIDQMARAAHAVPIDAALIQRISGLIQRYWRVGSAMDAAAEVAVKAEDDDDDDGQVSIKVEDNETDRIAAPLAAASFSTAPTGQQDWPAFSTNGTPRCLNHPNARGPTYHTPADCRVLRQQGRQQQQRPAGRQDPWSDANIRHALAAGRSVTTTTTTIISRGIRKSKPASVLNRKRKPKSRLANGGCNPKDPGRGGDDKDGPGGPHGPPSGFQTAAV